MWLSLDEIATDAIGMHGSVSCEPLLPPQGATLTETSERKEQLARLMLAAYRGTVDDEGETLEDAVAEVGRTIEGGYGTLLGNCSFMHREQQGSPIISASIVTLYRGAPLLAFSMTHPDHGRRGLARSLLVASIAALQGDGHSLLNLSVHRDNQAAIALYRSIGFCDVETDRD